MGFIGLDYSTGSGIDLGWTWTIDDAGARGEFRLETELEVSIHDGDFPAS